MDPLLAACILGGLFLALVGLFWGHGAWVVSREQRIAAAEQRADEAERELLRRELADVESRLARAVKDLDAGRDAAELVLEAQRGIAAAGRLASPRDRRRLLLDAPAGAGPAPAPGGPAQGPDDGAARG